MEAALHEDHCRGVIAVHEGRAVMCESKAQFCADLMKKLKKVEKESKQQVVKHRKAAATLTRRLESDGNANVPKSLEVLVEVTMK